MRSAQLNLIPQLPLYVAAKHALDYLGSLESPLPESDDDPFYIQNAYDYACLLHINEQNMGSSVGELEMMLMPESDEDTCLSEFIDAIIFGEKIDMDWPYHMRASMIQSWYTSIGSIVKEAKRAPHLQPMPTESQIEELECWIHGLADKYDVHYPS